MLLVALAPLLRLVETALWPAGAFDPGAALAQMSRRAATRALLNSLESSLIGAAGAVALGAAMALLLALADAPGRRVIAFLFVLSTMMAPQVVALAFLSMTGPASPLLGALGVAPEPGSPNPLLGRRGVIALLALHHAPLVFVTVRAGLRHLPRDLLEAARAAGATAPRIVWDVVAPLMRPYLAAAAALVFVACVGNFGIPAMLGMGHGYQTLPTLIYQTLASNGPQVLAEVAALSLAVAGLAAFGLGLAALVSRETAPLRRGDSAQAFFRLRRGRLPVAVFLWLVVLIALIAPLAALVAASLSPAYGVALSFDTITLENFVEVVARQDVTARALRNSFLYAGSAALALGLAATPVAHFLARRRGALPVVALTLVELPYALPGVTLAIAEILAFLKPLPVIEVSLYATAWIIVVAYLARFAILALRAPMAAIRLIPVDLEEAAQAAGAGSARRLRDIVAPLAAPASVAGALLVFLTAFNELTVSALLWSAGTETMGVVLYNLEDGGFATLAAAVGVISTLVVALVMLALDRLGRRAPEGVIPWR